MLRNFWISMLLIAPAARCLGQDSCKFTPGTSTITVDLRASPDGFEPACQPTRIRVKDKVPVTLVIRGLSPVEICAISTKAPTVTPVTNPLESLINTVTGLKSFSLAASLGNLKTGAYSLQTKTKLFDDAVDKEANARPAKKPEDQTDKDARAKFDTLSAEVYTLATDVADKQKTWQETYQKELLQISDYVSKDFRREGWSTYKPDTDLATIKDQST